MSITFGSAQGFRDYLQLNGDKNLYEIKSYLDAYYATRDKGRGSGYKQYRRWLLENEADAYPSGDWQSKTYKVYEANRRLEKSLPHAQDRSVHGEWISEGPINYVETEGWNGGLGRVNRLAFHPTDVNIIYACTPAGGLWISPNNGSSWNVLTDKLPRIGAAGLVINPQNHNIMYLLTGDADGSDTYSIGVLKSTDGGLNWSNTDLSWDETNGRLARKILMHPEHPDTLYVITNIGIEMSQNGGESWSFVQVGNFYDIEFQPFHPERMYASTNGQFYISENSGITWSFTTDTIRPLISNRIEIGVTPADSNVVYLLYGDVVDTAQFAGLYRSPNAGVDFDVQSTTPNILGYDPTGQDKEGQGWYDLTLAIDPTDENTVYVGGINIWKSINAGDVWNLKAYWLKSNNSYGYTHADIHALEWHNNALYVGSDGGVYRTEDDGDNWIDMSEGLAIMQWYNFDVVDGFIAGGTQDNGCNVMTVGNPIVTHTRGADGFAAAINYQNDSIWYHTNQEDLSKTTDRGLSFTDLMIPPCKDFWAVELEMHPIHPDTLFAGLADTSSVPDIFRSFNGAATWTRLNCPLNATTTCLTQNKIDGDRLYATTQSQVVRTENINATSPVWQDITNGLPVDSGWITSAAVDPEDSKRLWVSFAGFRPTVKVFMSPDTGATWINVTGALPNIPVRSIVCEAGNQNGVYIGTDIGIFYRNDNIGDWIYYSNQMPVTAVTDLDIDNGRLYAATFGRGIWSSDIYSTCLNGIFLTQSDPGIGHYEYHTIDFIQSSQIIEGGPGTNIKYNSSGAVTLTSGFHCKAANLFEVTLEGCPD